MTREQGSTQAEIRAILEAMFSKRRRRVDALNPRAPLLLELELDSLDAVDFAMELERHFGVGMTERDIFDATLESLANLIDVRRST